VHRDLKPENLLLDRTAHNPRVTIIDFGTAGAFEPGKKLTMKYGTPYYIARDGMYYGGTFYNASFVPWVVGARLDDINLLSAWQPYSSVLAEWVKACQTARLQLSSVHAPKSCFNYPKRQRRSFAAYSGHASVRPFKAPDSLGMSLVPILPRKSADSS